MGDPDDTSLQSLVRSLDDSAARARWRHQVVEIFLREYEGDDRVAHGLADAFRFATSRGSSEPRFKPSFRFEGDETVDLPLSAIPESTCDLWERASVWAAHPRVRARLHDLLFERRWKNVGVHALAAIEAYRELASGEDPPSSQSVDSLSRSIDIARVTGRRDIEEGLVADVVRAASASIDDPDPKPGVSLGLIELVVDVRHSADAVDQVLRLARDAFPGPWHTESTIALQRRRAPDDESRKALDRELIEGWLDEADRVDPLVAIGHRERAARLARDRGLPELVDRAVLAMQTAGPPRLARLRVEVPATVTDEQINEYISSLVGDSWWDSLLRSVLAGPPSGDVHENVEFANKLATEHPLSALFPRVRLGGDGLPRYSPRSEAEIADDRLADLESTNIQFNGALRAEALRRAAATYEPSVDEVAQQFVAVGVDDATAWAIGRAVRRFCAGDYEGTVYATIPLVERQCRALLLKVDQPIYRVQRERSPGTYPGLGAMLPVLADRGLDESWHRFLRTFLVAPNGWNYRNEALHGFVESIGEVEATLVLVAIAYLMLIEPAAGPATDSPEADQLG